MDWGGLDIPLQLFEGIPVVLHPVSEDLPQLFQLLGADVASAPGLNLVLPLLLNLFLSLGPDWLSLFPWLCLNEGLSIIFGQIQFKGLFPRFEPTIIWLSHSEHVFRYRQFLLCLLQLLFELVVQLQCLLFLGGIGLLLSVSSALPLDIGSLIARAMAIWMRADRPGQLLVLLLFLLQLLFKNPVAIFEYLVRLGQLLDPSPLSGKVLLHFSLNSCHLLGKLFVSDFHFLQGLLIPGVVLSYIPQLFIPSFQLVRHALELVLLPHSLLEFALKLNDQLCLLFVLVEYRLPFYLEFVEFSVPHCLLQPLHLGLRHLCFLFALPHQPLHVVDSSILFLPALPHQPAPATPPQPHVLGLAHPLFLPLQDGHLCFEPNVFLSDIIEGGFKLEGFVVESFLFVGDAFGEEARKVVAGRGLQHFLVVFEEWPGVLVDVAVFVAGLSPVVPGLLGRLGSESTDCYLFMGSLLYFYNSYRLKNHLGRSPSLTSVMWLVGLKKSIRITDSSTRGFSSGPNIEITLFFILDNWQRDVWLTGMNFLVFSKVYPCFYGDDIFIVRSNSQGMFALLKALSVTAPLFSSSLLNSFREINLSLFSPSPAWLSVNGASFKQRSFLLAYLSTFYEFCVLRVTSCSVEFKCDLKALSLESGCFLRDILCGLDLGTHLAYTAIS